MTEVLICSMKLEFIEIDAENFVLEQKQTMVSDVEQGLEESQELVSVTKWHVVARIALWGAMGLLPPKYHYDTILAIFCEKIVLTHGICCFYCFLQMISGLSDWEIPNSSY